MGRNSSPAAPVVAIDGEMPAEPTTNPAIIAAAHILTSKIGGHAAPRATVRHTRRLPLKRTVYSSLTRPSWS